MRGYAMTAIVAPVLITAFLVALYMIAPKLAGYITK
ncbi:gp049 [Rhodococcus phage ReqiPoco6]|uniref:Gp049 n=1 Tax=Rhodococcus phage ReqiPoco6 TaxID=691964 RepID=D4P7R7_9CAUD|nr:gp049 [Rhodococcus phage ReqiPoco6]ADD81047.1 gp049 [Rhodococcus phage ReqiPoco6]